MCYGFDFLSPEPLTPQRVRDVIETFEERAPDGWSCWAFSNHDVTRHASRWADQSADRDRYLKMIVALILSLRGTVCFYQGEELGLTEGIIAYEDLQDPYGIQFWPTFNGRDGCRTPMVWQDNDPNGGFSPVKPWLPVPPEHLHLAVELQEADPNSILGHYRAMLAFRRKHPEFAKGSIRFIDAPQGVLALERNHDGRMVFMAINMSGQPAEITLGSASFEALTLPGTVGSRDGGKVYLPAYGAWCAVKHKPGEEA